MEIDISKLKDATAELFNYLDEMNIKSVELTADYYWHIAEQDRYDVDKEPSQFTIGQTSFDWNELLEIQQGKSEAFLYGFVWLASVMRAVGEVSVAEGIKQKSL